MILPHARQGSVAIASKEVAGRLVVDVQNALVPTKMQSLPPDEALVAWAQLAYFSERNQPSELTIRLVSEAEMLKLNTRFRSRNCTTNVLSFGLEDEQAMVHVPAIPLLGDIVICHAVMLNEASEQQIRVAEHYAHIVTHGVLHLCGYDHADEDNAKQMEALETRILARSGISSPYDRSSI